MTENIPVDMYVSFSYTFYTQNETTVSDVEDIVRSQEGILDTETIATMEYWDWYSESEYEDYWYDAYRILLGVNDTFFQTFPDAVELNSPEVELTNTTCFIEEGKMNRLGLNIGENTTVWTETYNESGWWEPQAHNFTIVGTFTTSLFMQEYYWEDVTTTALFLITTQDAIMQRFGDQTIDYYSSARHEIWAKMDHSIVNEEDPITAMQDIEHRIEQRALPYARVGQYALLAAVYDYISWGASMRAIAIAFSIPTLVMAVMLIYYNSNLLADEERRDIGTLKTRGASGWQAFRWVLSTALATGLLGSFGAILTGAFSAIASATVREFLVFRLDLLSEFELFLTPEAIIAVFLFSFVVGFLVALPSAIRALLMTATEAHAIIERETLHAAEKMSSPIIDLIALGISGYLLSPLLMVMGYMRMDFYGAMLFASFVIPILSIFTIALTRLLARPTASIKSSVLARIDRVSLKPGSKVISGNVKLFKKSEAMGVMFVAMVFAAGIFSSLSATTGSTHMKEVLTFEVGADITVNVRQGLSNVTLDFLDNITALDSVISASGVLQIDGIVDYWTSEYGIRTNISRYVSIYGVQPSEWYQSAFWLDYFMKDYAPSYGLERISEDNSSVLASFKPVDHYLTSNYQYTPVYGNQVTLKIWGPSWKNRSECTIIDVMASSYDGGWTYLPGESSASNFIVVNLAYLQACLNTSRVDKIYVDIADDANYIEAIEEIHDLAPNSFQTINSAQKNIDDALNSRAGQTIYGAYTLNVTFAFLYLTAGVLIVAMVRFGKMRRQFSVMRALGAEGKSILAAVLVESLTGVIIAAAIGSVVGLLLTSFVIQLPLTYMGPYTATLWLRLPVFLAVPVALLVGIIGAAVLSSLAATYFVVARNLKRNIAQEVQYTE
ncbi:MAG: ABC transporter permease, partial [Candidatus Thorarchaeota archaeon]